MKEQCAHKIPERQENKVLGDTGYACAPVTLWDHREGVTRLDQEWDRELQA